MNSLLGLGKYLFIIPLLGFGFGHLSNANAMAGMVPIPGGALWIYVTGIAMLAAAVSIVIGKWDKLATTLLGIMLLIFALSIHLPGMLNAADAMAKQGSMGQMMKDIGLAGGAWMYAAGLARDKSMIG
ncbi:MAG: DoxX family protein [Lewinellaceae bacterium]|nr:DoxX family protein [Lewinellaceae bacterium]